MPSLLLLLGAVALYATPATGAAVASSTAAGSRQFIGIFDAGSSGTRLHVFEVQRDAAQTAGLRLLSEKSQKISHGLANFANAPERLRSALKPLMDFAKNSVPADKQSSTPLVVGATAGFRLLDATQSRGVVRVVAEVLRRSAFRVPEADTDAVRVLSGEDEAAFAWSAVNFLLGKLGGRPEDTYGMLDLGGASTQIAFASRTGNVSVATGQGRSTPIYARSYLGFGMNAVTMSVTDANAILIAYYTGCLNKGFMRNFTSGPVTRQIAGAPVDFSDDEGRYDMCKNDFNTVFEKKKLLNLIVHPIPERQAVFMALSGYFYTARMLKAAGHLKSIKGTVSLAEFSAAAKKACKNPALTGKYEPFLCLNSVYIVTLCQTHYRLPNSTQLMFVDKIKGVNAGWPPGMAFDVLNPKSPAKAAAGRRKRML